MIGQVLDFFGDIASLIWRYHHERGFLKKDLNINYQGCLGNHDANVQNAHSLKMVFQEIHNTQSQDWLRWINPK